MGLGTVDIAIVLAYLAGIFILAQWVSREKAGHHKDAKDYFLAGKALPWWAIGASLIAANISAEQIVGMSGSGYVIGLAIASYEWMAALTLLIVGKYFLPIFLANKIYTMPQFLEQRFGPTIRTVMAIFWLALYIFVNLTSILWLGSIAVTSVAGINQDLALLGLGSFALLYQLRGGLKALSFGARRGSAARAAPSHPAPATSAVSPTLPPRRAVPTPAITAPATAVTTATITMVVMNAEV